MGSRCTKVATPHVKAVASPVPPTQQHQRSKHANDEGPCQDHPSQVILNQLQPRDDINLESSAREITTTRRRYSEPTETAAMANELNVHGVRHLASFESFLAERNLMAIDLVDEVVVRVDAFIPVQEETSAPEEPEIHCIACCAQLPKETDVEFAKEAVKPCRSCSSAYCKSCIRNMFLDACKDFTRMPARCCTQIHLHYVKPHLDLDEIAEYKSKYEEWSTPKPFYCPSPTCSVFIPERLLPQKEKRKDSGIGTPVSTRFPCPKCESEICLDCRQRAHPGSLCTTLDLGVDAETAALLKTWGYKRCPRCSQGLKRMYGCSHMECLCGAHFCWGCLKSMDACDGSCHEDDDEDDEDGDDDDDNESNFEPSEPGNLSGNDIAPQATAQDVSDASATARPRSRPRNLDGGSADYWEDLGLDFGREPTGDSDLTWSCSHTFSPFAIPLAKALSMPPSAHEAECVKCWCVIQPTVEAPEATNSTRTTRKPSRTPTSRGRGGRRGRGRGVVARQRPTAYSPPRGLSHSDATVGTAPHLTIQLHSVNSGTTGSQSDPLDDIQSQPSIDSKEREIATNPTSATITSNIFGSTLTRYSMAQECPRCNLLVCTVCADAIIARQEADQVVEAEAVTEAEVEAQVEGDTDPDNEGRPICILRAESDESGDNEDPPPSIFD